MPKNHFKSFAKQKLSHAQQKISLAIALLLAAHYLAIIQPATPTQALNYNCDDVQFVFARGSGAPLGAPDYQAFKSAMTKVAERYYIKYKFYELGTAKQSIYQYPAAEIGDQSMSGVFRAAGALVSAGSSYAYGKSVDQGVNELKSYIHTQTALCPSTQFVIGGYSQGAQVISSALPLLKSSQILYAATFGDPKLYLPEGQGWDPIACHGKGFSSYRAKVPDCHTFEGILSGTNPYHANTFKTNLGAWCNDQDLMCGSSWNWGNLLGAHLAYNSDNSYTSAASKVNTKLAAHFTKKSTTSPKQKSRDVIILLDSTGSMNELIDYYRAEALRLATNVLETGGRIALYDYRDLADPYTPTARCILQSCTLNSFTQALNSLTIDEGGDTPESTLSALLYTMKHATWQKSATKSIVLLTDADYHSPDHDGTTLSQVTQLSLQIDPVNIFTLTPADIAPAYTELTAATGGKTFTTEEDLALSTSYILNRPEAALSLSRYFGTPGSTLTFDASESTADAGIDHFEWDLDGNGVFERTTSTPIAEQTYPRNFSGFVQVKVVDKSGASSTMSASVEISSEPTATLSSVSATALTPNAYRLNFTPSANTRQTLLAVNDTILGFVEDGFALTDLSGDNSVSLTPISHSGRRGVTTTLTLNGRSFTLGIPNCGQL